jgi:pSer/pThr/pTyr-binding forkhead associated (FHA) protein
MRAKLFSKQGVMKGKQFEFENEATIGRSEQNEIVLDRKEISKVHARIFLGPSKTGTPAAGCYYLEDLGSANGTQLDGIKVGGKERLGHLHVITFSGAFDFIFMDSDLCKNRRHGQGESQDTGAQRDKDTEAQTPQAVTPLAVLDETIVEEKPFVLPQGLGQNRPVEAEDKTIVEERPFVLPPGLGKETP